MRRRAGAILIVLFAVASVHAARAVAADAIGVFFDPAGTVTSVTTTTPNQVVPVWLLLLDPSQPDVRAWECQVALDSRGPAPSQGWTLQGQANNFDSAPSFFVGLGTPLPAAPVVVLATGVVVVPEAGQEVTVRVTPFRIPSLDDPLAPGHKLMLPVYGAGPDIDLFPLTYADGCGFPACRINDDGAVDPPLLAAMPTALLFDEYVTSYRIWLRNDGTQPFAGILSLQGDGYEFGLGDLLSPTVFATRDRPLLVAPGGQLLVEIRQAAGAEPGVAAQLVLDPCTDPLVVELGRRPAVDTSCRVLNLDLALGTVPFGELGVGFENAQDVLVKNNDPYSVLRLVPSLACDGFTYDGPETVYVDPGRYASLPVTFRPVAAGDVLCDFDLGAGSCGPVPLSGTGLADAPDCTVAPEWEMFGPVIVGETVSHTVRVVNGSEFTLRCTPAILPEPGTFAVAPGELVAAPGETRFVKVWCTASTAGFHEAQLVIAPSCPTVRLTATADVGTVAYTVGADSLDFGHIDVGSAFDLGVVLQNTGTLTITPQPSIVGGSSAFTALPSSPIQRGYPGTVTVRFAPVASGPADAVLDLGLPGGETVVLHGVGWGDEDRVGLYFDEAWTQSYTETRVPDQVVPSYLVFRQPSAGVAGWDLWVRSSFIGSGVVAWRLPVGGTIVVDPDIADGGCVRVRYDTPLPWGHDVVVAEADIIVAEPAYTMVMHLQPNPTSTAAAVPFYLDGADGVTPVPLRLAPGEFFLCRINPATVPVALPPAPAAAIDGDQVRLSWVCDGDAGYHVYRRIGDGDAERITRTPVSCAAGSAAWTDRPELTAPSRVAYSLTRVLDGVESVEGLPADLQLQATVPTASRLLANYPNPFNPETTLPFELAKTGSARLEIFDASGRLVTVLADGAFTAGRHVRVWNGRDAAGRRQPSGTYLVRLTTGEGVRQQKVMLLK